MPVKDRQFVGLGHVGSYQVPGRPFLSSSIVVPASGSTSLRIDFEGVARRVTVVNETSTGSAAAWLRVGFSDNGIKGITGVNYRVLKNGESLTGEWKVINVFLMGDAGTTPTASISAEITGVTDYNALVDGWSGSVGVG